MTSEIADGDEASAKAIAKIAIVFGDFGRRFRIVPMASTALEPIQPIASAGTIVPMPMAAAVAIKRMLSISM